MKQTADENRRQAGDSRDSRRPCVSVQCQLRPHQYKEAIDVHLLDWQFSAFMVCHLPDPVTCLFYSVCIMSCFPCIYPRFSISARYHMLSAGSYYLLPVVSIKFC